jgi:hypothetical protein
MSRNIQNDHPWSADEIQYKLDRNLHKEVDENQKMFPPGSDLQDESPNNAPVLNLDQDIFDHVSELDTKGLQQELRANGLKPNGDDVEMKVALAQHLQGKRDDDDS